MALFKIGALLEASLFVTNCLHFYKIGCRITLNMSRTARHFPEQGFFHVLARGNNRAEVFHQKIDYFAYLGILGKVLKDFPMALHHYCLMPNHVHLLVSAGPPHSTLSEFMRRVQLSYAIYYKARYEYVGHLWQGRFKGLWVESERYFFVCAAYIELNPVVAKLVEEPGVYPFSSYARYAFGVDNPYLTPHSLYEQLGSTPGDRQRIYRGVVVERLPHRSQDQLTVGFSVGVSGRPRKNRDASRSVPILK